MRLNRVIFEEKQEDACYDDFMAEWLVRITTYRVGRVC